MAIATPTRPAAAPAAARPADVWRLVAVAVAVVLPFASSTLFALPSWELRWALLPAIAGAGLAAAAGLARHGVAAARWGLAFLAWALVAAALAPNGTVALWGEYRVGTGLVFLAALVGAWAIGVRGGPKVAEALLVGCVANAAVAIASQLTDLGAFGAATYQTRSAGLYGNPVYLAELLCGGLWLALCRVGRGGRWGGPAVVLIAAGIELSGSRAAIVLVFAATVVAVWRGGGGRRRVGRVMAGLVIAGLVVAGLALGTVVAAAAGSSATGTERTGATPVSGYQNRLETWDEAAHALASRPLWGWGPGGTLAAVGPHRTASIAVSEGADTMFADAHDFVVDIALGTGLAGLALLILFVVGAARAARPELLGFFVLVMAVTLVEPMHPGVTPLAFLALGAAGARVRASGRRAPALTGAAALVGLGVSAWLALGLVQLHRADIDGDPAAAARAASRLPAWGEPDAVVGRLVAFDALTHRTSLAAAQSWWTTAARRDAGDPSRWNDLGGVLLHDGRPADALAAYERALTDNPWSARALRGVIATGRGAAVVDAGRRLAILRVPLSAPSGTG